MRTHASCLAGGGEAGERLRAIDWAANPLGPVEAWPLSLQAAVRIVLGSRFPMMLHWGPELITVYNDAYAPSLGGKHPGNLGRPAKEWWSEVWDQLAPIFERVEAGEAYHVEDARYTPDRDGVRREAFFTHCHSPLWDDDGAIAGVFLVVTETTRQVVAERELVRANERLERQVEAVRASEERLQLALDAADLGTWDLDLVTDASTRSPRHDRIFGYDEPPATWGREVAERHVLEDDRPAFRAAFARATETGALSFEARLRRPDGTVGWIAVEGRTRRDGSGRPVRMSGVVADVTVRKQAETSLVAANETLGREVASRTVERERIWELSRDLLGVADDRGVWLSVSPAWSRTLGWSADEIVGRTSEWIEHPDDRSRTRAEVDGLAAGDVTQRFENRFRTRAGDYRTLSWTAVPEDGLLYCVARDVTEARAEAASRAEQAAARERTWRFTPDLLSVIDMPRAAFERVNPAWSAALGWAPEDVEGRPFEGFVHPDDLKASRAAFETVRGGAPVFRFENRYRTRGGDWRWLSWVAFPEGDKLYSSARDVTAEKAGAASLHLFENIVQSDASPILAFDRDHRLTGFNRAHRDHFLRVMGHEQRVGEVLPDLFPPDQAAVLRGLMDRALDGEAFTAVEGFGDADRVKPTWEIAYTPLRDGDGRVIGAFHHARDVSAKLRAERDLGAAQDQLRQSQKMEAVGQLTGGVAHDFNNLLTIIRSSVDFLRRPELPEARKVRYLDAVSETVDRAAKLTGQLLAFARRQALKPEVFEVGAKLRGIGDMLDTVTGSRVRVTLGITDEPALVRADVSQFETALVNMAVNARDAMDGEGRLALGLERGVPLPPIRGHAASDGPFVAISIGDTGSGIPPERLERIFEPFFTTKEVGKGTGLGLSQVFGFAKQSGGDVDVRSAVGEGTTFTLYLPEERALAETAPEAGDASPLAPVGAGRRVLVVEDNIDVGKFCTQILEDLDYATVWAPNAEEALCVLGPDGAGFDVVFSDVVMPGMGGVALARTLRERLPDLPVVLASGYSHVLAQEAEHGFELLHKPYSAEQLARILQRVTTVRRRG